jgi:hypothetical protein
MNKDWMDYMGEAKARSITQMGKLFRRAGFQPAKLMWSTAVEARNPPDLISIWVRLKA